MEQLREQHGEVPFGCMCCTAEEYPRVLSVNEPMLRLLETTRESENWQAFQSQNIFFMVPFEDHALFRGYLQAARESVGALAVEHRLRTETGELRAVIGWVELLRAEAGEMLRFLYMPLPQRSLAMQGRRERAYLDVLKGSQDLVFEIDHLEHTITCLSDRLRRFSGCVPGVRILMNEGLRHIVLDALAQEERAEAEEFLRLLLDPREELAGGLLRQDVSLCAGGVPRQYRLTVSRLDDRTTLLCMEDTTAVRYTAQLEEEVERLRIMQRSMIDAEREEPMRVLSFRLLRERVFPVSGQNVVCCYADLTEEEYVRMRAEGMELREFLGRCHIRYGEYLDALQEGETDCEGGERTPLKLYLSAHASLSGEREEYTMQLLYPQREGNERQGTHPRVSIRTFGHFDVFVDGEPVVFHYEKSKEMLAVLVDRNGGYVSNPYFITCLWETEPYSEKVQGRCRQAAHRLMATLKQYGIEHIIEKSDGKRRIVPELVDCDYYNFIRGRHIPGQQFGGAYMSDYSWGEETLSSLLKMERPV